MSAIRNTVYLVDDDEQVLSGVAMYLKDKHFEVRTFTSGLEFLKIFPVIRPSVIVLDMHMPEISGLDIQTKLIEIKNQSPVFFLSGESNSQQIIDALKRGADEFFLKPVSPAILFEALTRVFKEMHQLEKLSKERTERKALLSKLTSIEVEILQFFLHGHSNKMIGEAMSLKADTIKKRRAKIYDKLQVGNLPELLNKFSDI